MNQRLVFEMCSLSDPHPYSLQLKLLFPSTNAVLVVSNDVRKHFIDKLFSRGEEIAKIRRWRNQTIRCVDRNTTITHS